MCLSTEEVLTSSVRAVSAVSPGTEGSTRLAYRMSHSLSHRYSLKDRTATFQGALRTGFSIFKLPADKALP